MNQRADHVGELALRVLSRGGRARVTRVFPGAAYARSRDDFILLLWGTLKSPMTINVHGTRGARDSLRVHEGLVLSEGELESSAGKITVGGAAVHRGSLRAKRAVELPTAKGLAKCMSMLRSMYDVSPSGPLLVDDPSFRTFLKRHLVPYSMGEESGPLSWESFEGLIGRGGGFTPAGDDFVSGFTAVLNFVARVRGTRELAMPKRLLLRRTVPESGAMVACSAMGYVDEDVERLILASLGAGGGAFNDELLAVAPRGHTSGADTALGVLLCDAALAERERRDGTMELCLAAL